MSLYLYCCLRSNYQKRLVISFTCLIPPSSCVCPPLGPVFPTPYVVVILCSVIWDERWLCVLLILMELFSINFLFIIAASHNNQLFVRNGHGWPFIKWIPPFYMGFLFFLWWSKHPVIVLGMLQLLTYESLLVTLFSSGKTVNLTRNNNPFVV